MPTTGAVRRCNGCNQTLPLTEFRRRTGKTAEDEGRVGQPYGRCKSCNRKRTIKRTDGNMAHAIEALLWTGGRRKRKHLWNREELDVDFLNQLYVKQSGRCAITGYELTAQRGQGFIPTNITIDRIDNSRGYDRDNVQLVCRKANEMKGMQTQDELVQWCLAVLSTLGRPKD